ncbi:hypothetical protein [Limimaricola pyoseonensis]|uniref:PPC domain-containing protein n=1 Tax=Limimaricola pyoseonensis TaxID=521013 RepID=A0A1G7FML4_9RHOB|nr:hypothetical protein [Limimaricola pyoseonensis]SDE77161.1 hypothetical protein SAMN04488567_2489 [Limimaricola pyoseonensis]
MTRDLVHPGPTAPRRVAELACHAHPLLLRLRAGMPLDAAVAEAFAAEGFAAGYLRLCDVAMARLDFVCPAPAPGHGPVAWYSATARLAPARVEAAGLHLGTRDGAPFLHGHGLWRGADGVPRAGHLLGPDCRLAEDVWAEGWGLSGAALEAAPDDETGFTLFAPRPAPKRPGGVPAVLCTLRPNVEPLSALAAVAARHGLGSARIEGLGSLVGAAFAAEAGIGDVAAELLVLRGAVSAGAARLEAVAVGFDGGPVRGALQAGVNRVCVTCEMLLLAEPGGA